MSLRFLLDANVLSESLRPQPNSNVLNRLHAHQDEMAIASVVWHELVFGCNRLPKSKRRIAIEQYLYQVVKPSLPILPYDDKAAQWHASERARLTAIGKSPPFADGQIAAIAVVNDLTLVTANIKDFERFDNLNVIDWRE